MCHLNHSILDELVAESEEEELMRQGLEEWDLMERLSEIIEWDQRLDVAESELEQKERLMEMAQSKMVALQLTMEELERQIDQHKTIFNSVHIAIALFVTIVVVFRSSAGRGLFAWLRNMFG